MNYWAVTRKSMKELVSKGLIEKVGEYYAGNPIYRDSRSRKGLSNEGWCCQNLPSSGDYQLWSISDE